MSDPVIPADDMTEDEQSAERLDADKLPDEFPDRPQSAFEHGTTAREMREGEPLEDRLRRELPDLGHEVNAPPVATGGPLLDDADEDGGDRERDLVAEQPLHEAIDDSGQPHVPMAAEEAALSVEEQPPGAVDRMPVRPEDD
ncbi:hypothetical protein BH23ACT9_BH23ACT9_07670 [soil metagenome]